MQDQQFDPDPGFFEQYGPLILIGALVLAFTAVTTIRLLLEGPANKAQPVVANRHEADVEELIKSRMEKPYTYRHVRTDGWVDDGLTMLKITYQEETATDDTATKWLAAAFSDGVLMWYYEGTLEADSNSRTPSPAGLTQPASCVD